MSVPFEPCFPLFCPLARCLVIILHSLFSGQHVHVCVLQSTFMDICVYKSTNTNSGRVEVNLGSWHAHPNWIFFLNANVRVEPSWCRLPTNLLGSCRISQSFLVGVLTSEFPTSWTHPIFLVCYSEYDTTVALGL